MRTKHSIGRMTYPTATQPEAPQPIPLASAHRPACDAAANRRKLIVAGWIHEMKRQRVARPHHGDYARQAAAELVAFGIASLTDDERYLIWRGLSFPPDPPADARRRAIADLGAQYAKGNTEGQAIQEVNLELARLRLEELTLGEVQSLRARVWS